MTISEAVGVFIVALVCIAWIDIDLRIKRQK